ncbi:cytochrome c biogenesis protein DipZ [Pseudorhodoferax soli]|uniref:Cytochrome c biogenesis protein CcdA n=1 Tax=Pseudorhodoferax soli TaxID=545864 RepID=A0A368XTT6_9BURK|nr:cytochrome c biogenesis protein DipZ [Pseudorhodoferax soli]RCW70566.1 cytochrome c biogenesis protein CcdA [Pseudorhodoferax soli]
MVYFILSYLAGALTLFAPCILPVVPFVFARVDQPFRTSGLPLLAGMALTFAAVASLGAFVGDWAVQANEYGRTAALVLLAAMGAMLIAPRLALLATRPLVAMGNRLSATASQPGGRERNPATLSFLLGAATGLLWAPCAGPVLGLILTGAALHGPSVHTSLLLLAYALGAVSALAVLLAVGQRTFAALRRTMGIGEGLRKAVGVAVLAGVAAIALGLDTGTLAERSLPGANGLEQRLIDRLRPQPASAPAAMPAGGFLRVQAPAPVPRLDLPVLGAMPPIEGAVGWLNSPALSAQDLRGKVVLVDFWTFGCINCRNALPHVREWHRKYKDQGLVVLGVHTPEFAYEKNTANVQRALVDLDVPFPVALDNNFAIWRAFRNNYWPALYFVDARGQIRFHHVGEGAYEKSEQVIQQLLDEARKEPRPL